MFEAIKRTPADGLRKINFSDLYDLTGNEDKAVRLADSILYLFRIEKYDFYFKGNGENYVSINLSQSGLMNQIEEDFTRGTGCLVWYPFIFRLGKKISVVRCNINSRDDYRPNYIYKQYDCRDMSEVFELLRFKADDLESKKTFLKTCKSCIMANPRVIVFKYSIAFLSSQAPFIAEVVNYELEKINEQIARQKPPKKQSNNNKKFLKELKGEKYYSIDLFGGVHEFIKE